MIPDIFYEKARIRGGSPRDVAQLVKLTAPLLEIYASIKATLERARPKSAESDASFETYEEMERDFHETRLQVATKICASVAVLTNLLDQEFSDLTEAEVVASFKEFLDA